MPIKVLEFGPQEMPLSEPFFPDADITVKPLDGVWWEIDGKWDAIFSFYNFTKVPFPIEDEVLVHWTEQLEEDGLLYLIVPSLEYMARMALQELMPAWWKPMMFNATNHFTMKTLRILFNRAGLNVTKAETGEGHLNIAGEDVVLEQHFIIGRKR